MSSRVIYLKKKKKISILSCEEDEGKCITKILGKIYDLHEKVKNTKLNFSTPNNKDIKNIMNSWDR